MSAVLAKIVDLAVGEGLARTLDTLLSTRRNAATEVLARKARSGRPWVIAEDAAAAALLTYLRAAEEGVARRNLEMLAEALSRGAEEPRFAPDEFRRQASRLADLNREEIILLAALLNTQKAVRGSANPPEPDNEPGDIWIGTIAKVSGEGKLFRSEAEVTSYAIALGRTGWVASGSAWNGLVFYPSPQLEHIARLVDFEIAAAMPD